MFPARAGAFRRRSFVNDDTKRTMDDARMSLTATETEKRPSRNKAASGGHGVVQPCASTLRICRLTVKIFVRTDSVNELFYVDDIDARASARGEQRPWRPWRTRTYGSILQAVRRGLRNPAPSTILVDGLRR